jgi:carbon-monoxide dehydrogenase medium subunit
MMKLRLANLEYLIDINDLHDELGYIRVEPGKIRVGAMTRHRELLESDALAEAFPIFRDAERVIADPVVRNRGTLGGSLCQADPSEDLSAVCTTLDASCVIRGSAGERVVTMEEFHRGPYETAIEDNEMLIEVRIPVRAGGSSAYEKVERRAGDWAVVSCGAAVWMDGGVISDARVGLAAVGPNTTGIPAISQALRGKTPSEELYEQAGAIAAESCSPSTDMRGSVEYKRHLADELTRRALRRSISRINGQAV